MFSPEPPAAERCRVLYVSPLKALAVDVERNLRAPIAGIQASASRLGVAHRVPTLAIRSGDTPARERARIARTPPDILITTPESLYLLLTSRAQSIFAAIETVIVDEIHAVAASKRGTLVSSNVSRRRRVSRPLQRIGLSATQRPLEEIARLLGGGEVRAPPRHGRRGRWRSWTRRRAQLDPRRGPRRGHGPDCRRRFPPAPPRPDRGGIDLALDLSPPRGADPRASLHHDLRQQPAARRAAGRRDQRGGWRRVALAHHGSVAREKRQEIEDRLNSGTLLPVAATSSLELGIDMERWTW
jgi:ATP-dependent Lhr-like helicase